MLKPTFIIGLLIGVVGSFLVPPHVKAGDELDQLLDMSLEELVLVVANPIIEETSVDAFSTVSSMVTEEQLSDQNAVDLASALRRTPGVQISRFNPVGSFGGREGGSVYIRGMGVSRPGSEIKTYIDGTPFYMATWNHPLLDILPINIMSSITVYKSPQPQINGNNFASINLTTKRAVEEGIQGNAKLSIGSFNTIIEQVDVVGRTGDWDFMLAQGFARSDGHRDNADGELKNVMGHIGKQLNNHWSVGVNMLYSDNEAKDPGDDRFTAPTEVAVYNTRASMVAVKLSHQHDDWQGDLLFYRNSGFADWLNQPGDQDTFADFEMSGLRWKETLYFGGNSTLIGGIDIDRLSGEVQDTSVLTPVDLATDTFRITSPYLAVSHDVTLNDDWMLTPSAGVRYYEHSEFDSELAPHVGLSLLSDNMTLFANIARGINYPGLEAPVMAAYIPPLGTSWKTLEAEELNHIEVGGQFSVSDSTQIDITLFRDELKNRYVFAFPPAVAPPPQFINLGEYEMRGAELAVTQDINDDWRLFVAITLLDPDIDTLPYTPDEAATLGVNGKIDKVSLAVDAQYQSKTLSLNRRRNSAATNTEEVGSFTVVNARAAYPVPALGERGELFLAVDNLFDSDYSYQPGYPMAGASAQLGVSASF